MSDDLRVHAIEQAVRSGAKPTDIVKTAADILAFLTAGNASGPTEKPATETAKTGKASAQKADEAASGPSSDKSAASTETATQKEKSPSDTAASGFADDGSEITIEQVRAAAVKYVAANDEKALFGVLEQFGVEKLSALTAPQYAEFIAALEVPVADASVFD